MTFDWEIWSKPLMVLAAGIVIGVGLLMRKDGTPAEVAADGKQRDLEAAHTAALASLKTLELDRGKMTADNYEVERKALIARGSAALRALDEEVAAPPTASLDELVALLKTERKRVGPTSFDAAILVATGNAPVTPGMLSAAWRGALSATALWGVAALMTFMASSSSSDRIERPMDPPPQAQQAMAQGPTFEELAGPALAALQANPQDIAALNELTQAALSAGDPSKAMEYNRQAFEVDSADADARVYKAVLAAVVGMNDRAVQLLEALLADHPDHVKGITYYGLLLMEVGRFEDAIGPLEKAAALQPNVMPLKGALIKARQGGGAPMAPPPRPAPSGPVTTVVEGTAFLDAEAAAALTGNELVFVSVKSPAGGPPLAALRLPAKNFPIQFKITSADAISMGGPARPFPQQMMLSVRIDSDGNAITREGGPEASQEVTMGDANLRLMLK